jgi:hypothetical protein
VFSMRSLPGCYKQDKEVVGSTTLETVTRQRLAKTQQTEDLVRAEVNCGVCELAIAL